jgi:hypothetical protein
MLSIFSFKIISPWPRGEKSKNYEACIKLVVFFHIFNFSTPPPPSEREGGGEINGRGVGLVSFSHANNCLT